MSKELKTAKENDDVLRMAKDRKTIQMSAHSEDDYKRIVGIAYDIKKDGYIGIADTTGSLSLWLTQTGELFLGNGGYEYKNNSTKMTSTHKWCYDILWKIIIPIGVAIVIGVVLWKLGIKN